MIVNFLFLLWIPTPISSFVPYQKFGNVAQTSNLGPKSRGRITPGLIQPQISSESCGKETVAAAEVGTANTRLTLAIGSTDASQNIEKPSTFLSQDFPSAHDNEAQGKNLSQPKKYDFSQSGQSEVSLTDISSDEDTILPADLRQNDHQSKNIKNPSTVSSKNFPGKNKDKLQKTNVGQSKKRKFSERQENEMIGIGNSIDQSILPGTYYFSRKPTFFSSNDKTIEGSRYSSIYLAHEVMGIDALKNLGIEMSHQMYDQLGIGEFSLRACMKVHTIKSTVSYIQLSNIMFEPPLYEDEEKLREAQRTAVSDLQQFWKNYQETDGFEHEKSTSHSSNLLSQEEKKAFGKNAKQVLNSLRVNQISNVLFLFWMRKNFFELYQQLHQLKHNVLWAPWFMACVQDKLLSLDWANKFEKDLEFKNDILKKMRINHLLTYQAVQPLKLRWKGKISPNFT